MTQIPLSLAAYDRSLEPQAVLLNAHVELAPVQQATPTAIRARAGFDVFQTVGTAPLRALFAKQGLFSEQAVVISNTTAYLLDASGVVTALTGTLPGSSVVDIDAGQDADLNSVARAATGSALYKITTTTVTNEDFPTAGGAGASSICYHRGFWFAAEAGTDQVFYQVPGDTTWTALSFASAEYAPDVVVAVRSLGEQIWFLGGSTSEVWALTGTATPAVAPYGGMVFDYGCRAQSAAVSLPGALIWVDNACQVRMSTGGAPSVISDPGLAEQIRQVLASDLRGSWYQHDGHVFYQLTLAGTATWAYDVTTQRWATRSSLGFDYSRIGSYASLGDAVLAGNSVSNVIYKLNPASRQDEGLNFPVEFTAVLDLPEGAVSCANVELVCEVGDAPRSETGPDPLIGMKYSDDGGKSWSRWRYASLGRTGQSMARVRWRGLGMVRAPHGRIFRFRVADAVGRRFSDLRMNVGPS